MKRVAVDPVLWARLVIGAGGLPRTVQASLTTLSLLMSASGSVRNAVAHLVRVSSRARSTISEHLGMAQATGWLSCVERGGFRVGGGTPSVYQASVPIEVWDRREELLAVVTPEEPDQSALPTFALGTVIAASEHVGPSSGFSSPKINQSILHEGKSTPQVSDSSTVSTATDPVVAAVIEELGALTGRMVSPAWAARCVSQIMRHRQVRHPIAYLVKTLQNAAQDGTLEERFLPEPQAPTPPPSPTGTLASSSPGSAEPEIRHQPPAMSDEEHLVPSEALASTEPDPADPAPVDRPVPSLPEPEQEQTIYRPKGRTLSGLGVTGARELLRLREQFEQRKSTNALDHRKPLPVGIAA